MIFVSIGSLEHQRLLDEKSSRQIYHMYLHYKKEEDFVGMDMCRKFLEMGFTRGLEDMIKS